jgi:hypothetical protein
MSWVVWRQHRLEGAWSLALGAALAAFVGFVAYELHVAGCAQTNGYCFRGDFAGLIAQDLVRFNIFQYGLVVLPALAGAFIGCPIVAREIENGTHRLVWTQGVSRLRWLAFKLILVFLPLLAIAAAVGILESILLTQLGATPNHWAFFDQQAPMTVAATLFAMALGVAMGAVMGRSIPAMAVTLVAFVAVRIGLAELGRPNFVAPLAYTFHNMSNFTFPPPGYPDAWWVDDPTYYDAAGHTIANGGGPISPGAAYAVVHYQPGDLFWRFQTIESAILCGLGVILIAFTIYWVTRRVG